MSNGQSFIRPEEIWRELGLRAGQTVVHLGSGPGFFLIPAAKIVGTQGKAIGIDLLPDLLAEVENRATREGVSEVIDTIRANLENSSGSTLAENSSDWVLVANILHQSDPTKILAEAKRILKADGTIVVIEWDTAATPLGPPADQRIPKNEVMQHIREVNLDIIREFRPSPYHYGLVLNKHQAATPAT